MPLYDYRCTDCGRVAEVRHGFDESYAEPCAACGGPLQRVFNAAAVLFKGSGFYVTDSRKNAKSDTPKADSAQKPAAEKPAGEKTSAPEKPAGEQKAASSEPAA